MFPGTGVVELALAPPAFAGEQAGRRLAVEPALAWLGGSSRGREAGATEAAGGGARVPGDRAQAQPL